VQVLGFWAATFQHGSSQAGTEQHAACPTAREKKKGAVDRLHARSPKQMQLAGGQIFS